MFVIGLTPRLQKKRRRLCRATGKRQTAPQVYVVVQSHHMAVSQCTEPHCTIHCTEPQHMDRFTGSPCAIHCTETQIKDRCTSHSIITQCSYPSSIIRHCRAFKHECTEASLTVRYTGPANLCERTNTSNMTQCAELTCVTQRSE